MRRSTVFFSRSSNSAESSASRYPTCVCLARTACSAREENWADIVGIRSDLQCCFTAWCCSSKSTVAAFMKPPLCRAVDRSRSSPASDARNARASRFRPSQEPFVTTDQPSASIEPQPDEDSPSQSLIQLPALTSQPHVLDQASKLRSFRVSLLACPNYGSDLPRSGRKSLASGPSVGIVPAV